MDTYTLLQKIALIAMVVGIAIGLVVVILGVKQLNEKE